MLATSVFVPSVLLRRKKKTKVVVAKDNILLFVDSRMKIDFHADAPFSIKEDIDNFYILVKTFTNVLLFFVNHTRIMDMFS